MRGSFQDRVKKLAELVGSAAELAKRSGLSRRTIGAYMSGETDPKRGDLLKLAESGGVSLNWLAAGIGEMNGPDATTEGRLRSHSAALAADMKHRVEQPAAGYVHIPLYDVRAGAGRGRVVESEQPVDALAFKEDWIRQELRASPGDLRLINVSGDSMEPDLRAGDIILIDHTDTRASREGIYVIRMDGALLVKQLQRLPGGVVKVISRNQAYEAFTVAVAALEEPNGFAIIGRVVWACRRL